MKLKSRFDTENKTVYEIENLYVSKELSSANCILEYYKDNFNSKRLALTIDIFRNNFKKY